MALTVSRANVDLVRALFEAIGRRDTASVLEFYDREVAWDASRAGPGEAFLAGTYHGHDGLRRYFRDWYGAWEDLEYHLDELIDAGEQVISAVSNSARGRASGAEVCFTQFAVWTFRDGKIARVQWFGSRDDALAAAGEPG